MPNFWHLPNYTNSQNSIIFFSNFVLPAWKLNNPHYNSASVTNLIFFIFWMGAANNNLIGGMAMRLRVSSAGPNGAGSGFKQYFQTPQPFDDKTISEKNSPDWTSPKISRKHPLNSIEAINEFEQDWKGFRPPRVIFVMPN